MQKDFQISGDLTIWFSVTRLQMLCVKEHAPEKTHTVSNVSFVRAVVWHSALIYKKMYSLHSMQELHLE